MAEHISTVRKNRAAASLQARISVLEGIVKSGELPSDFDYHSSNKNLMAWVDDELGITKVGVNTARDSHRDAWDTLQELRKKLTLIELDVSEPISKAEKVGSGSEDGTPSIRANSSCNSCQQLSDELIMLRTAYLELLDHHSSEKTRSRLLQDAIRRHSKHKGLRSILDDNKRMQ